MPPKIEAKIYDVTVRNIKDFGNETRHFELFYEPGQTMNFIPGQFVSVLCPNEGKVIRRAYSICSPPRMTDHIDLCLKLVHGGVVTNWFWKFKDGDRFQIHGPFGKFVLPDNVDFEPVFVATGTGIAPFRSMIDTLLRGGFKKRVSLLFGARYDNMVPYHDEFTGWTRQFPNFTYVPTISRPRPEWKGESGYVQTKIEKFFGSSENRRVYICGLNEMIQAVQDACLKQGYQKEQIAFERYD